MLIAGSGTSHYVAELERRAHGLPVEFVGRMSPDWFFPKVDITVVPSVWNEPLGRVVIESFAFERPVVATPVGGIPELIRSAAGTLALSTTADDFADAIRTQIGQDETTARRAAAEAAKRFSSQSLVGTTTRAFIVGLRRRELLRSMFTANDIDTGDQSEVRVFPTVAVLSTEQRDA